MSPVIGEKLHLKNGDSSMLIPQLKRKRQIVSALNCKRRKISAIRKFPNGCGPFNEPNTDVSVIRDFPNGCGPCDASLCKQSVQGVSEPNVDVVSKDILQDAESCGKKKDVEDETIGSLTGEETYLKNNDSCMLTPEPKCKRRKVSAIRKFPSGCGPNAASVCKQRVQGVNEPERKGLMEQVVPSSLSEVEMKESNLETCGHVVKCKNNKLKNLSVENPRIVEDIQTFEETEVRQDFPTILKDFSPATVCGLPADCGRTKLGHSNQVLKGITVTKVHETCVMGQNEGFLEWSDHREDMTHEKPINDSVEVKLMFPTILNDSGAAAVCRLPADCGRNLIKLGEINQLIKGQTVTKVDEASVTNQNEEFLEGSNHREETIHEKPIILNDSGAAAVCGLPADCGDNLRKLGHNNQVIKGMTITKVHESGVMNQNDGFLEGSNHREGMIYEKHSDIDEGITGKMIIQGHTFEQSSQNERQKEKSEENNDDLHLQITEQSGYNGNNENGVGSLPDKLKVDTRVFEDGALRKNNALQPNNRVFEDGALRKNNALQPNNSVVMEIERGIIVLGLTSATSCLGKQAAKLSPSSVNAKKSNGKRCDYDMQHKQKRFLTKREDSEEKLMEKPKVVDDKKCERMEGMPKSDTVSPEKDEDKKSNSHGAAVDIERDVIVLGLACAAFSPWTQAKNPAKLSNGKTLGYDAQHNKKHSLTKCKDDEEKLAEKPIMNATYLNKEPIHLLLSDDDEEKLTENPIINAPYLNKVPLQLILSDDEDDLEDEEHVFELLPRPKNHDVTLPCSSKRGTRTKVQETLRLFELLVKYMLQGKETISKENGKDGISVHLRAANVLKKQGKYMSTEKVIGSVPGVEIGDSFSHCSELEIIGLHSPVQMGIETITLGDVHFAISVVASGGYDNDVDNPNVLIYTGETHKLDFENLALKNCIDNKNPVRVIRAYKASLEELYTYDGLYTVEKYWSDLGPRGKLVYKFELIRVPGQRQLTWEEVEQAKNRRRHESIILDDISNGKEITPISAVNIVDNEKPPSFTYITSRMYPDWCQLLPLKGCDCKTGCSISKRCSCTLINGGAIPYNLSGAIVEAKNLVYECGPSCNCPPSCPSRVSQHGIKLPLEIFKTESMGWGVRCLSFIPSGTFICEYIGELLDDKEAEQRVGGDEYLFDIGRNSKSEIEIPSVVENVGFTIDAARCGNIGRFFNHSCSPNLYAQNVLYDHEDERVPHVMLFAAENISPLQELTYHYNYSIDQVYDSEGNIKIKKCCCGSLECTGRMY